MNQPNPREIEFIKRSWMEALSDIPEVWLERSYVVAIKDHQNGPFAVSEICQGWLVIKESDEYKKYQNNSMPRSACKSCAGTGWARIYHTDKISGISNQSVKPCECPGGLYFDKSYRMAIDNNRETMERYEL